MKNILIVAAALTLASRAYSETATAALQPTTPGSTVAGTVTLEDTSAGLKITANLTGVPPGEHGFHIHEFGSCADSAKAAGGHFNPLHAQHGFEPKDGIKKAHGGDMGNIKATAEGAAQIDIVLPNVTLSDGKYTAGGRAIVLHEKVDDFSQPVGNAGGRIACGPIVINGK